MKTISSCTCVLVAALLSGCDPGPAKPGPQTASATPGWHGPVGTLESPLLSSYAKVVVKRAQNVWVFMTDYDAATDSNVNVPCTLDADCSAFPGASCQTLFCKQQVLDTSIFYVGNLASPATIHIPCDGLGYVAEVYGASATAPHVLDPLDLKRTSAPVAFPATCSPAPAAPSWDPITAPGLTLPATIYVGLGAPWDKYSVQVDGLAAPWSTSRWSMTASGVSPTNTGNPATFLAPLSGSADISFVTKFYLETAILLSGEAPTSWELTPAAATKTPTPSGDITP